jgi:selenocysteine lyase/cysteine desulfurase
MARTFGCEVEELRYACETPTADDLSASSGDDPSRSSLPVHFGDVTGVVADIQALAAVAKEAGALVVADGSPASARCRLKWTTGPRRVISGCRKR